MERIEDLIEFGSTPVEIATGVAVAAPIPLDPAASRPPLPKIKPDADDRLLWGWIKEFCGAKNWCDGHLATGQPMPASNATVEGDLNSPRWQDRLPSLTLARVAAYRRGRPNPKPLRGEALHLKPARTTSTRSVPAIALRIDADAHEGQTDARALIERIGDTFLDGRLYHEPSRRGHAGYLVLDITPYPDSGGETIYPSRKSINDQIDALQASLTQMAAAWRYAATVEVNGRYMITGRLDDGTRKVTNAGRWFRAPRCSNAGDVQRLVASRFGEEVLTRITGAAEQTKAAVVPAVTRESSKRKGNLAKAARQLERLADTGDKHRNRVQCVRLAVTEVVGSDRPGITDSEREKIKDLANEHYHEKGFNGGERDEARDRAIESIINWLVRTHDPDAAGLDPLWFTVEDIDRAGEIIRSRLSRRKLRRINEENQRRLRGHRISYFALAVALSTYAKNVRVSDGQCPATAISGMLRHFGVTASNAGSVVNLITETLTGLGLLRCVSTSYKPGRWCRRYETLGKANELPFVVEFKPEPSERQAQEQQARRYTGGAGRGPIRVSFTDGQDSSLTSIRRIHYSPVVYHDGSEVLDAGYWASIEALQAEFCMN